VVPVIPFRTDAEAIAINNDTEYGLSAGHDHPQRGARAAIARRLETGMCHVNCSSVNDEPHVPFGGSKASGLGRHGGRWSIETFTETRWITLERGGPPLPAGVLRWPLGNRKLPLLGQDRDRGHRLGLGIGLETARICTAMGATVLGVDVTKRFDHVDEFYRADLSDRRTIDALVDVLPERIDGLANIAGLPPTAPADKVLKVNLFGLKRLTLGLCPSSTTAPSIVNLASLAGFGWAEAVEAIRASEDLGFDDVPDFMARWGVTNEGGRSYFFSKEALIVWTMQNRWTWRDRGIRMNAVSPGPVDTPILPDFVETLGARAEEDMRTMDRPGRGRPTSPRRRLPAVRHDALDPRRQHPCRRRHVVAHPVRNARALTSAPNRVAR
jgi:NAD(P)-dependent dehydrogenase (short-subunit alcohol dehydrogenase family)